MKALLLKLLKVPPQPDPPAGAPESVRIFRAAKNFYWLNVIKWGFTQVFALIGLLAFLGPDFGGDDRLEGFARIAQRVAFGVYFLQLPFTFFLVRLDYSMRWYIVTDRSLRIRYGVQHVREMTLTFANIQHIAIQQGPLQRMLGLSDLQVRSAGGGTDDASGHRGRMESMHVGYFRGVNNAREIRDVMVERLRRLRDTGLGDPDEAAHAHEEDTVNPVLLAANELLEESRALRRTAGAMKTG